MNKASFQNQSNVIVQEVEMESYRDSAIKIDRIVEDTRDGKSGSAVTHYGETHKRLFIHRDDDST